MLDHGSKIPRRSFSAVQKEELDLVKENLVTSAVACLFDLKLPDGWWMMLSFLTSELVNYSLVMIVTVSYWVYGRCFFLVPRIAWWLSMVMLVYQRVKSPFSCGFLMVFLCSHSNGFSHDFLHFHMAFPIIVPFSYGFSCGYVCKPWPAWLSLSSSFWPGIRSMLRCRELSWT